VAFMLRRNRFKRCNHWDLNGGGEEVMYQIRRGGYQAGSLFLSSLAWPCMKSEAGAPVWNDYVDGYMSQLRARITALGKAY
jgi:hypothetical protein